MTQLSKFRTFLEMRPNSTIRLQSFPHNGAGGGGFTTTLEDLGPVQALNTQVSEWEGKMGQTVKIN